MVRLSLQNRQCDFANFKFVFNIFVNSSFFILHTILSSLSHSKQVNFVICIDQNIEEEEIRARAYLDELNDELNERKTKQVLAEWNFNVNITKENEERKDAIAAENAEFSKVRTFLSFYMPCRSLISIMCAFHFDSRFGFMSF